MWAIWALPKDLKQNRQALCGICAPKLYTFKGLQIYFWANIMEVNHG